MKKQLLFIAIASLFTTIASATDLYVREAGAGGAYSTISAAITAAANGDRIIVKPKAAGAKYIENLTINKSLTFLCENNFERFYVEGTISITSLAGRIVTIHNLNLTSSIVVPSATTGGRTTVNIYNTYAVSIGASQVNTTVNMSGCIIYNEVYASHGRFTSNNFGSLSVFHANLDTTISPDDIEVIGNIINSGVLYISQKSNTFKVLNNFVSSGLVVINGVKNGSTNEITNNVVTGSDQNAVMVNLTTGNTGVINVMNNVLNMAFANPLITNANTNATVNASYNMAPFTFTTSTNVNSTNNSFGDITINNNNYTVTGANVNAGSPATEYTDLNLSRNDIGNFGGSNSWENYWPSADYTAAQVNYLVTPRIISTGTTTLNVTGSGFSK